MIKVLFEHIYYILAFKHNGQGLKTDKVFTRILFLICLCLSLLAVQTITITTVIINFFALLLLCKMTSRDLSNGILLVTFVYLTVNLFIPSLSLFFLVWIMFAISKMHKKYHS